MKLKIIRDKDGKYAVTFVPESAEESDYITERIALCPPDECPTGHTISVGVNTPDTGTDKVWIGAFYSADAIRDDIYLYMLPDIKFSATFGWPMPRAGSITAVMAVITVSAVTTPGNVTIDVRKNDAPVLSATITISGTGDLTGYNTAAVGANTFVAGDLLQVYLTFTTFVGTLTKLVANVEVST